MLYLLVLSSAGCSTPLRRPSSLPEQTRSNSNEPAAVDFEISSRFDLQQKLSNSRLLGTFVDGDLLVASRDLLKVSVREPDASRVILEMGERETKQFYLGTSIANGHLVAFSSAPDRFSPLAVVSDIVRVSVNGEIDQQFGQKGAIHLRSKIAERTMTIARDLQQMPNGELIVFWSVCSAPNYWVESTCSSNISKY